MGRRVQLGREALLAAEAMAELAAAWLAAWREELAAVSEAGLEKALEGWSQAEQAELSSRSPCPRSCNNNLSELATKSSR